MGEADVTELALEFLAEIDEDLATLRRMSDEELGQLFKDWLHRRHAERFPAGAQDLPLKVTWPEGGWN